MKTFPIFLLVFSISYATTGNNSTVAAEEKSPAIKSIQKTDSVVKKPLPDENFTTTELMQNEARATVALLERLHISKKQMAEIDPKEVINSYCENLDPGKMYFTQAEVDEYTSRYGRSLDLYLSRGNLTPAFEIYQAFRKHVEERTTTSVQSLNNKIDLNQPGFFPIDRKKGNWPNDVKEANDLWERRLRLDILSELLGDDRTSNTNRNEPKQKPSHETKAPEITPEKIQEAVARLKKRYEKIKVYLSFDPKK
jgi:carboxyl-terminal processing protease